MLLNPPLQFGEGLFQARLLDRFEQVVEGLLLESLQGILVVRGDEDHVRHPRGFDHAEQSEAVDQRHLDVEKEQVEGLAVQQPERLDGIGAAGGDFAAADFLEQRRQFLAGEQFIVDDHHPDHGPHPCLGRLRLMRVHSPSAQATLTP